jgi:hypothetical protein
MISQDIPSICGPFEFTSGDHVVSLNWNDAATARVDISLRGLALADPAAHAEALLLLHRLNAVARPVHPWIISIDDEDMLLISASVAAPSRPALAEILTEGLARAHSLDALWQTMRDGHRPPESIEQEWAAPLDPLRIA